MVDGQINAEYIRRFRFGSSKRKLREPGAPFMQLGSPTSHSKDQGSALQKPKNASGLNGTNYRNDGFDSSVEEEMTGESSYSPSESTNQDFSSQLDSDADKYRLAWSPGS